VFDREVGADRVITDYSAALLRESPAALWERFDVPRGRYTIEAFLLKPPDFDAGRRYPVILDVHGGPQSFYGYGFDPVAADAGHPRLPGRLLQPAWLDDLRPRVHPAGTA